MTTQYDKIQRPYDEIRKTSIAIIERENVHRAVAPFVKGARVLDLACGSGFYSLEFLYWGASHVVGVDIASGMLAEAHTLSNAAGIATQITLLQADCTEPVAYAAGPFDLVFGAWLLNYAPSKTVLTAMFRNIALNLKDGGRFVGVTPPPSDDPVASYAAENKVRPQGSGLLIPQPTGEVEDGITCHDHADTEQGPVDFDFYHLKPGIYKASARDGGLKGSFEWRLTTVPDGFLDDRPGGASIEEIESYKEVPNYGILIIQK